MAYNPAAFISQPDSHAPRNLFGEWQDRAERDRAFKAKEAQQALENAQHSKEFDATDKRADEYLGLQKQDRANAEAKRTAAERESLIEDFTSALASGNPARIEQSRARLTRHGIDVKGNEAASGDAANNQDDGLASKLISEGEPHAEAPAAKLSPSEHNAPAAAPASEETAPEPESAPAAKPLTGHAAPWLKRYMEGKNPPEKKSAKPAAKGKPAPWLKKYMAGETAGSFQEIPPDDSMSGIPEIDSEIADEMVKQTPIRQSLESPAAPPPPEVAPVPRSMPAQAPMQARAPMPPPQQASGTAPTAPAQEPVAPLPARPLTGMPMTGGYSLSQGGRPLVTLGGGQQGREPTSAREIMAPLVENAPDDARKQIAASAVAVAERAAQDMPLEKAIALGTEFYKQQLVELGKSERTHVNRFGTAGLPSNGLPGKTEQGRLSALSDDTRQWITTSGVQAKVAKINDSEGDIMDSLSQLNSKEGLGDTVAVKKLVHGLNGANSSDKEYASILHGSGLWNGLVTDLNKLDDARLAPGYIRELKNVLISTATELQRRRRQAGENVRQFMLTSPLFAQRMTPEERQGEADSAYGFVTNDFSAAQRRSDQRNAPAPKPGAPKPAPHAASPPKAAQPPAHGGPAKKGNIELGLEKIMAEHD